jgi:hypothetical protein
MGLVLGQGRDRHSQITCCAILHKDPSLLGQGDVVDGGSKRHMGIRRPPWDLQVQIGNERDVLIHAVEAGLAVVQAQRRNRATTALVDQWGEIVEDTVAAMRYVDWLVGDEIVKPSLKDLSESSLCRRIPKVHLMRPLALLHVRARLRNNRLRRRLLTRRRRCGRVRLQKKDPL